MKLDLYKQHSDEYAAPRKPVLVTIKPAKYLAIAGRGMPADAAFKEKIGALYSVAFTIKMASKFAGRDYAVCKLEGLWWGDGEVDPNHPPKIWNYKLLIRTPHFITPRHLKAAIVALLAKGKTVPAKEVKLETVKEGNCVQMLHVGPYTDEARSITQMRDFAKSKRLRPKGAHHEVYLSDPRRVAPQKLRTILRQPVR